MKSLIFILLIGLSYAAEPIPSSKDRPAYFEYRMEKLRQDFAVPGMAWGIVYKGKLVHSAGHGYANLKTLEKASIHTPFHIASITKTFAGVSIMQLVAAGKVDLDKPAATYGVDLPKRIKVRHLLSHTSGSKPGTEFAYDGGRYGMLATIINKAGGSSVGGYYLNHFLKPLNMRETAYANDFRYKKEGYDFDKVIQRTAQAYRINKAGQASKDRYYSYFGTSAGLVSTVSDLAKYAAALQQYRLLDRAHSNQMWTAERKPDGSPHPYGLGWFVQSYEGLNLVFHYGIWNGSSSLLLHIPELQMSFIMLSNCQRLSSHFDFMGKHGVASSSFALAFLHSFVFGNGKLPPLATFATTGALKKQLAQAKDHKYGKLYKHELIMQAIAYNKLGKSDQAAFWFKAYQRYFGKSVKAKLKGHKLKAYLQQVGNDSHVKKTFTLTKQTTFKILVVGEYNKRWRDYAWISEDKEKVWEMPKTDKHAGGTEKNRYLITTVTLEPGTYTLHFKTDASHAWLQWNDYPPLLDFYGVVLYE